MCPLTIYPPAGTGDVTGPASATNGHIAVFSGSTGKIIADGGAPGGTGTVTSVSVATANGFSGTVANATTTPAITIIAGAITPSTVNGMAITTNSGTFHIGNAKSVDIQNSLTLTGQDGNTVAFQWEVKTSGFTAVAGHQYQVDTSGGAVTATLPASANVGDVIQFQDATQSFATNALTLDRNGLKVNGTTSNYTGNVTGSKLTATYISSGYGWNII